MQDASNLFQVGPNSSVNNGPQVNSAQEAEAWMKQLRQLEARQGKAADSFMPQGAPLQGNPFVSPEESFSFKRAAGSFAKHGVDFLKGLMSPTGLVTMAGIGAAAIAFPVIMPVVAGVGLVMAGVGALNSGLGILTAENNAQREEAVGGTAMKLVEAALAWTGVKAVVKHGPETISEAGVSSKNVSGFKDTLSHLFGNVIGRNTVKVKLTNAQGVLQEVDTGKSLLSHSWENLKLTPYKLRHGFGSDKAKLQEFISKDLAGEITKAKNNPSKLAILEEFHAKLTKKVGDLPDPLPPMAEVVQETEVAEGIAEVRGGAAGAGNGANTAGAVAASAENKTTFTFKLKNSDAPKNISIKELTDMNRKARTKFLNEEFENFEDRVLMGRLFDLIDVVNAQTQRGSVRRLFGLRNPHNASQIVQRDQAINKIVSQGFEKETLSLSPKANGEMIDFVGQRNPRQIKAYEEKLWQSVHDKEQEIVAKTLKGEEIGPLVKEWNQMRQRGWALKEARYQIASVSKQTGNTTLGHLFTRSRTKTIQARYYKALADKVKSYGANPSEAITNPELPSGFLGTVLYNRYTPWGALGRRLFYNPEGLWSFVPRIVEKPIHGVGQIFSTPFQEASSWSTAGSSSTIGFIVGAVKSPFRAARTALEVFKLRRVPKNLSSEQQASLNAINNRMYQGAKLPVSDKGIPNNSAISDTSGTSNFIKTKFVPTYTAGQELNPFLNGPDGAEGTPEG